MTNLIAYETVKGGRVLRPCPKVVFFDLWKTLTTSHCTEPIHALQQILGHQPVDESGQQTDRLDDGFLRACLTLNERRPHHFVTAIAQQFNRLVGETHVRDFEEVINAESGCTALFLDVTDTLLALQAAGRYELGVISNLWAFPADYIFDEKGLGQYFKPENRIFSFEIGHRKPEPEIFLEAARRLGVDLSECLMIGDNVEADVQGALDVGMQAAVIDRLGTLRQETLERAPEALYLRSLKELIPVLAPGV